jgi:ribosomal-protein-alanine N-acetyltransferase
VSSCTGRGVNQGTRAVAEGAGMAAPPFVVVGQIPTLITSGLILRPFELEDAPAVRQLAGQWDIAEATASKDMAQGWISTLQGAFDKGEVVVFAITLKSDGRLIGAIRRTNRLAEMGYWLRGEARHMAKNVASGRVMRNMGMKGEDLLRQSIFRWGKFEDAAIYSIMRGEYLKGSCFKAC